MVVTFTSCSIEDGVPSWEVSPQPITVAVWLMYKDSVDAGRQMGAAVVEMLRGLVRVRMDTSMSAVVWL